MAKMNNNQGFTLVEMLVAVTVFMILAAMMTDLFVFASRTQKRTAAYQLLQNNTRFIMEKITREVRGGYIDYQYYLDNAINLANPVKVLALKDIDNNSIVFKESEVGVDQDKCPDINSTPCVLMSDNGGAAWAPLSISGVKNDQLRFIIKPDKNPFYKDPITDEYANNIQPRVTLIMVNTNTNTKVSDRQTLNFQTTVTTRIYQR